MTKAIVKQDAAKFIYDREVDALYIRIKDADISSTEPLSQEVIVDQYARGEIVGIEILDIEKKLGSGGPPSTAKIKG